MAKKKEIKNIEELLQEALIPKEEQPYEIPSNWEWVKLGSVITQIRGVSYKKDSELGEKEDNVTILRGGNIQNGEIKFFIDDTYISKNLVNDGQYLKKGDIVLVGSTGSKHLIGKAATVLENMDDVAFGAFLKLIRCKKLEKFYLGNYFQSNLYRQAIQNASKGININNITNGHIDELIFPLPPLSEQTRIVNKLESMLSKLKEAKEKIAEAKESFELRRASILHKAFTGELTKKWREENKVDSGQLTVDSLLEKINEEKIKAWEEECKKAELEGKKKPSKPKLKTVEEMKVSDDEKPYDLPEGWEWVKLGDVGDLARGKSQHRPRNDVRLFGGNYPFIQTGDVARSRRYVVEHSQTLSEFGKEQSRLFPKGTVCITIAANIGDTAILSYDCCFPDSVVGFITSNVIDLSEYVNFYFELIKRDLEHLAPATAQKNINLQILNDVALPLPPLSEQQEIVARIENLLKAEEDAGALLNMEEQIDLLEKSILSKAFRGELGTNDPSDEPALELLKRVLGEEKEESPKIVKIKDIPLTKKAEFKTVLDLIIHMKQIDITEIPKYIKIEISNLQNELLELKNQGKINEVRDGWKVILEAVE